MINKTNKFLLYPLYKETAVRRFMLSTLPILFLSSYVSLSLLKQKKRKMAIHLKYAHV